MALERLVLLAVDRVVTDYLWKRIRCGAVCFALHTLEILPLPLFRSLDGYRLAFHVDLRKQPVALRDIRLMVLVLRWVYVLSDFRTLNVEQVFGRVHGSLAARVLSPLVGQLLSRSGRVPVLELSNFQIFCAALGLHAQIHESLLGPGHFVDC